MDHGRCGDLSDESVGIPVLGGVAAFRHDGQMDRAHAHRRLSLPSFRVLRVGANPDGIISESSQKRTRNCPRLSALMDGPALDDVHEDSLLDGTRGRLNSVAAARLRRASCTGAAAGGQVSDSTPSLTSRAD